MVGKLRNILILAFVLYMTGIFCVPAAAANGPEFRLDIDNLNLQKGFSVSLVVSMVDSQGAKIESIEGIENFDILSKNSSISINTSINISGNVKYSTENQYYTLMPKIAGEFVLKAIIEYNGKLYETNALYVTVSESSSSQGEAESDLFVKTVLSGSDVYLGEKIVVTYELYTRYNIENFGFTDYTSIDGIIAKEMPENQLKSEYVYLDGAKYAKYEAKQLILDPIKAGSYTIPAFNMQVNVVTDGGPGGIFGGGLSGFFNRTQPMYLQTEEKKFTVKPLPSEGKPKDFSGIVGELHIESTYSRNELNYGDSLSLQITASGNCNLDGFKNIFSGNIPGFSVYETQKNTAEYVENNQYYVQKEFEAILVPEKNGVIDIKPFYISYFNPVTNKYEKAEISGTSIAVLGDMPAQVTGNGSQTANFEKIVINQVNYSKANDGYFVIQINKQLLYFLFIGLGVLIVFAIILFKLISNRKKQDQTLKSLYKQLNSAADINEIYSLFCTMIKHRYNLSIKAATQTAVRSSLPNADLAAKVTDIMDYMESREEKKSSDLKNKIKNIEKSEYKIK